MANLEDKVNEILGLETRQEKGETKEFQPPVERPKGDIEIKTEKDINQDYSYSRDSYYNLIDIHLLLQHNLVASAVEYLNKINHHLLYY